MKPNHNIHKKGQSIFGTKTITSTDDLANITRFFNDIKRYEPLTRQEEHVLIKRYQKDGDPKALDELLKSNYRFVVTVSKRYQNQGIPLLDIIQEGSSGMVEAAKRFDLKRDIKFFSYAVWWIKIKILDSFEFHKRLIEIPINRVILIKKVKRAVAQLEDKLLRYPTMDEIRESKYAKEHFPKATNKDLEEALGFTLLPVSLFTQLLGKDGSEAGTMLDITNLPNELAIDDTDRAASLDSDLRTLMYQLPQRQYDVLVLCLGLNSESPTRQQDVGLAFGLKDKEVANLKSKAIKVLQRYSGKTSLNTYL